MKCPNCNSEINDSAKFCPNCGTKIQKKQQQFCSNCGKPLGKGMSLCPYCGTPTNGESVQRPAQTNNQVSRVNQQVTNYNEDNDFLVITRDELNQVLAQLTNGFYSLYDIDNITSNESWIAEIYFNTDYDIVIHQLQNGTTTLTIYMTVFDAEVRRNRNIKLFINVRCQINRGIEAVNVSFEDNSSLLDSVADIADGFAKGVNIANTIIDTLFGDDRHDDRY